MKYLLVILVCALSTGWSCISAQVVWQPVGAPADDLIFGIRALDDQSPMHIFGFFDKVGSRSTTGLAYLDGDQWLPLGSGTGITPFGRTGFGMSMELFHGELYCTGRFEEIEGVQENGTYIAKWKDSDWVSIGKCDGDALLQVLDDRLMVFGNFDSIGGSAYHHLAEWVDGNWVPLMNASPFGPSDVASVMSMGLYQGSYYVGGNLNFGNGLDGIVRWDGQSWRSVGGGLLGPYIWIRTMAEYKGLLFVGGYFWKRAGNAADYVMAWDGEKWFDPFPGVTFVTQPNMLKVIDKKLYILGAHLHESIVGTYSMAHFDGNYFCSFGNGKEEPGDILKWNGELYFCGDVLSQYPNTVKYIGKWIGGESTDICHHNPLPVEYLVSGGGSTVLYPNPPDRYFSLQLPDSATSCELAVYDAAGREVMGLRPWALGDEAVDISMLPAGVYVVEVRVTGQVEYIKLVKL